MKKLPLAVSALVTAISAFYLLTSVPFPFVQAWWHAADYDSGDHFSKRHRMADWLVMTDALIGLRRDEVLAKLGPPPLTDRFTDYDLVYHLGVSAASFPLTPSGWRSAFHRLESSPRLR